MTPKPRRNGLNAEPVRLEVRVSYVGHGVSLAARKRDRPQPDSIGFAYVEIHGKPAQQFGRYSEIRITVRPSDTARALVDGGVDSCVGFVMDADPPKLAVSVPMGREDFDRLWLAAVSGQVTAVRIGLSGMPQRRGIATVSEIVFAGSVFSH